MAFTLLCNGSPVAACRRCRRFIRDGHSPTCSLVKGVPQEEHAFGRAQKAMWPITPAKGLFETLLDAKTVAGYPCGDLTQGPLPTVVGNKLGWVFPVEHYPAQPGDQRTPFPVASMPRLGWRACRAKFCLQTSKGVVEEHNITYFGKTISGYPDLSAILYCQVLSPHWRLFLARGVTIGDADFNNVRRAEIKHKTTTSSDVESLLTYEMRYWSKGHVLPEEAFMEWIVTPPTK